MSKSTHVVIWDAVGNITWGMRGWDEYDDRHKRHFLAEDSGGRDRIKTIDEFLAPHAVRVTHVKSVDELDSVIADADALLVHKVMVPADTLRKGHKLKLIELEGVVIEIENPKLVGARYRLIEIVRVACREIRVEIDLAQPSGYCPRGISGTARARMVGPRR